MSARSGKDVAPVGFPPVTRGQLRRVGEKIAELPGVEKVILFGSYARGNPTPDSDVDLLVVWKTRRPRTERWMAVSKLFSRRPFPMDIVVRTPRQIKDALMRKDCFIREIVSTGKKGLAFWPGNGRNRFPTLSAFIAIKRPRSF
ncbi:MAG: DNA polymerase beta domain protein region [Actinobacteria bacterium]|nr:DNA polymerase beta domain protein region [Actinomycetota bacterium]